MPDVSNPVRIVESEIDLPITAASLPLPAGAATSAAQATGNNSLANIETARGKFWDTVTSTFLGLKFVDGQPRFVNQTYLQAIAEGSIPGHVPWSKIGFAPSMSANVNTDIWSYSGTQPVYLFPTSAMGMEVLSSNNVDDIGTVIHSGTSDAGTSTTVLTAAGENFLTTTAAGDVVILDKSGASPEYGYITSVDSNTQITCGNGFSRSGTTGARAYSIIDTSAKAGAHAIEFVYLDGSYVEKREIVILNGTTVIATVNTDIFRINSFRVIADGANNVPTGNLTIRHLSDTPVYSFITAGFNRARNIMYTIPSGKTLYVTKVETGYATTGNANKEYGRITTRANVDPTTKFRTGSIFYPYTDSVSQNFTVSNDLITPTKLPEKTDIKVSIVASANGISICTLRGWLE